MKPETFLGICCALLGGACAEAAAATGSPDLTSLTLEQLLDVPIVGASKYEQRQSEVAAAVSVITRREIQAFGWRTLAEALSSLPGLYTSYNRQNAIVGARGFGLPGDFNTRLLVMIDGNRINDPIYDAGRFAWDFPLDLDLIERIEFIPGPGGAVYGQNAMFGVVNVITRTGGDIAGPELALTYQDPQRLREGRASFGHSFDDSTNLSVSVSGLEARGEDLFFDFGSLPVSGVAVGSDGQKDEHVFSRIVHGPLSLEYVYSWAKKDDPTAAYFSNPLAPGESQTVSTSLVQLKYEDEILDHSLQVETRAFNGTSTSLYTGDFFGAYYQTRGQSQWHGAELRLLSTQFAHHKLMIGTEVQVAPIAEQGVHGIGFVNPTANFWIHSPGTRVGLYFQDEWRVADDLSITLGLREDRDRSTGTKASPRAALIWQALPVTTVKALYGVAHRAPNAYERDYGDGNSQIANPRLGGERIDTAELVVDHRIDRSLTLRTSIYRWHMRGLITQEFDPASGIPPQYQTGPDVSAHGIEVSADKTWDSGTRLRGSLSDQHTAYPTGLALLNSPKQLGKLNLSQALPVAGIRGGYELQYGTSRLTRDGITLGGYALSNLSISTEALAKGLTASASLDNLFDKRYAQPGAENNWQNSFVQDGRSIRLKVTQKF
jgi:iron complex outermembrane receptor protein